MQDYFKYDKIQGASPLCIKSDIVDRDGVYSSGVTHGVPLGIKSVAQGIQHFTNWDMISNSLQSRDSARFDDTQPNSLIYGVHHTTYDKTGAGNLIKRPVSFMDQWVANDVTILDDLAFVSYEDYSDTERIELPLVGLQQAIRIDATKYYDTITKTVTRVGTLFFETTLPIMPIVHDDDSTSSSLLGASKPLSGDFAAYENAILKVDFNGKVSNPNPDVTGLLVEAPSPGDPDVSADLPSEITVDFSKTLYFTYGGIMPSNFSDQGITLNDQNLTYPDAVTKPSRRTPFESSPYLEDRLTREGIAKAEFNGDQVAGQFYIIPNDNPNIGPTIQLDIAYTGDESHAELIAPVVVLIGDEATSSGIGYLDVGASNAMLIKIHPVRKCGKVDIYTRKKGIITAAVGNALTSQGHNLNTNDVIQIDSALFDGTENSFADIHPLNGKKFVKKIDDDTFEVYDDEFFGKQTLTSKLRTTDGINWVCISNNFGTLGQSWDYYGSMMSPMGRNGYVGGSRSSDTYSTEGSRTTNYITTKRPSKIDSLSNIKQLDSTATTHPVIDMRGAITSGGANNIGSTVLRFDGFVGSHEIDIAGSIGQHEPIHNQINTYFAQAISDNTSATDIPTMASMHQSHDDFYPYFCQETINEQFTPTGAWYSDSVSGYWGMRFGCALDFKLSHTSGDSKVYTLAIGERGSDVSVDMWGAQDPDLVQQRAEIVYDKGDNSEEWLVSKFRPREVPSYLPHGRTHVFSITVDKYNRISAISHDNTLFGGGDAAGVVNWSNNFSIGDKYFSHHKISTGELPGPVFSIGDTYTEKTSLTNHSQHPREFIEKNPWRPFTGGFGAQKHMLVQRRDIEDVENDYFNSLNHEFSGASRYWLRSSIFHWFPVNIENYEYGDITDASRYRRQFPSMSRGSLGADPNNNLDNSRFGHNPLEQRIDRWNAEEWYIFPWVDSFGKSVAIKTYQQGLDTDGNAGEVYRLSDEGSLITDNKAIVLSASRTRSNIEIDDHLFQPMTVGVDGNISTDESDSQLGQITAHFLYSSSANWTSGPEDARASSGLGLAYDLAVVDYSEFNATGAMSAQFFNGIEFSTNDDNGINSRALPKGYSAGDGLREVINSAELSINTLIWKDDFIFWADQRLGNQLSTINIFKFNTVSGYHQGTFAKDHSVNNDEEWAPYSMSKGNRSGDGFGMDIRYDDGLLITASLKNTTDIYVATTPTTTTTTSYDIYGNITTTTTTDAATTADGYLGTDRLNFLCVHEMQQGRLVYLQSISPTFNHLDNQYPDELVNSFASYIAYSTNATYDNDFTGSATWKISLEGRFDVIDKKIILKDPLEYSLFGIDESSNEPATTEASEIILEPYLDFQEEFINWEGDESQHAYKTDPNDMYEYGQGYLGSRKNIQDQHNNSRLESYDRHSAWVFFVNISDIKGLQLLDSLTIDFEFVTKSQLLNRAYLGNVEKALGDESKLARASNPHDYPKIVLYKKDPRSTICRNGPADSTATNYNRINWPNRDGDTSNDQAGLWRGGAHDLFFYGTTEAFVGATSGDKYLDDYYYGAVNGKTLGEQYDETYGTFAANRGETRWIAPDMYHHISDQQQKDIVPYATLVKPTYATTGRWPSSMSLWSEIRGSLTLSRSQIYDHLIAGSLIKSSADNRTIDGSHTLEFDDINKESYNETGDIAYTLAIGFITTSVTDFNIKTGTMSVEEDPATGQINIASRSVEPGGLSRYAYGGGVAKMSKNHRTGNTTVSDRQNNALWAQMHRPSFVLTKNTYPKRRYHNKFHRIAFFEYSEAGIEEVRKSYLLPKDVIDAISVTHPSKAEEQFAQNHFLPVPLGISNSKNRPVSTNGAQAINPIIRFGKSSASAENTGGGKGSFAKSIQVVNTENLYFDDTSYYINEDDGKLTYRQLSAAPSGEAFFNQYSLMGGFDIQEPEFLSLFIRSISDRNAVFSLIETGTQGASGLVPSLFTQGVGGAKSQLPLFLGMANKANSIPLVTTPSPSESMPLFLHHIPLTAETKLRDDQNNPVMPLFIDGPNVTGNLPLTFTAPPSGSTPLYGAGPLLGSGLSTLITRGLAHGAGQAELFTSGVGFASSTGILFTSGVYSDNNNMNLVMNFTPTGTMPLYVKSHDSGNMPLVVSAAHESGVHSATIVLGSGYFDSGNISLFMSGPSLYAEDSYPFGPSTSRPSMLYGINPSDESVSRVSMPLAVDGTVGAASSDIDSVGPFSLKALKELFDLGGTNNTGREDAISRTLDGDTFTSNSVNGNTLTPDAYDGNRMHIDASTNTGLSMMATRKRLGRPYLGDYSVDPAISCSAQADDNNASNAFYRSYSQNVRARSVFMRQDAYDSNGQYLVKADMRNDNIYIGMYTINADGSVSQQGMAGKESTLRTNPGLQSDTGNSLGSSAIDPFYALRTELYDYIKTNYDSEFQPYHIAEYASEVSINDLTVSEDSRCAISFRVKLRYARGGVDTNVIFNVILVFRVDQYISVADGFNSTSDYGWAFFEELGSEQAKTASGYSISFDGEDLYFDKRIPEDFGQIWKMSKTNNYASAEKVLSFADLSDAAIYTTANNRPYIDLEHRKVGFGYPIKIYKEYGTTGDKLMFVGATLFDPYVFNDLTHPYFPNAMGAVYIYKRAGDATSWTYYGAVYSKGYTSDNISSNLTQYRDSFLGNDQYALFGYDFDYREGNLVVSEPGGNDTAEVNVGRAYLFSVDEDNPVLRTTYVGSDISLPDGATLQTGDNFGSSIMLPGKIDPITWSDATSIQDSTGDFLQYSKDSTIYNLRSSQTFGFDHETVNSTLTHTDRNLKNETDPYNTSSLDSLSDDVINRWSTILSMKLLKFGNIEKVVVIREFVVRADEQWGAGITGDSSYEFRLQKLSVLDLARTTEGNLFIKGPLSVNNSITLFMDSVGASSGTLPLVMKTDASGVMPLVIPLDNNIAALPMHIESITNNPSISLSASGSAIPHSGNISLFMSDTLNPLSAPLFMPVIDSGNQAVTLNMLGAVGSGVSNSTNLWVGVGGSPNKNMNLILPPIIGPIGDGTFDDHLGTLCVSGSEWGGSDNNMTLILNVSPTGTSNLSQTLYITTTIPPTGEGGGYLHSGVMALNTAGSGWAPIANESSLYVRAYPTGVGSLSLYLDRPVTHVAPLYIENFMSSGDVSLYTSGNFVSSGVMTLFYPDPPQSGTTQLFTKGYLE